MREKILTIPRKTVDELIGDSRTQLLPMTEEKFVQAVRGQIAYRYRDEVENDLTTKQLIAYVVVRSEGCIFGMRRLKKQTEARLHDRLSIGVGGHINTEDLAGDELEVIRHGLLRELHEEVWIEDHLPMRLLGFINDNSTEVGQVHTGICYLVDVPHKACSVRETDKMEGVWMSPTELRQDYDRLETWSQIALDALDSERK